MFLLNKRVRVANEHFKIVCLIAFFGLQLVPSSASGYFVAYLLGLAIISTRFRGSYY